MKDSVGKNASGASEVAAFKVDRHLGYDRVPLTTETELHGKKVSVQLRVHDLNEGAEAKDNPRHLQLFDYLIGNEDRNPGNHLLTRSGRAVAVDHGMAFKFTDHKREFENNMRLNMRTLEHVQKQTRDLYDQARTKSTPELEQKIRSAEGFEITRKMSIIAETRELVGTRETYERLKRTSPEDWKRVLGPELTDGQIETVMERQRVIIDSVESARRLLGDDVFQPTGPR